MIDQLITIELEEVPLDLTIQRVQSLGEGITMFGLHRHECKTSVLHFTIRRVPGCEDVVKSKTPLIIYVSYLCTLLYI